MIHKIEQNSVFISPHDSGSSIGYYLKLEKDKNHKTKKINYSLNATVVLSDCAHKIDWDFYGEDDFDLEKIDAAIRMLKEFRERYVSVKKELNKLKSGGQR